MKTDAEVEQAKALIKEKMPGVYENIQLNAKAIGKDAFTWVRRGLQGEPDCFYAFEAGYVVGTPFNVQCEHWNLARRDVVCFGSGFVTVFGYRLQEASYG